MRKMKYYTSIIILLSLISITSVATSVFAQIHDVSVVDITANPTKAPKGAPVYITITVSNKGNFEESFTVYVFADGHHPLYYPPPNPQPAPPEGYGDEYVLSPQSVVSLFPGENVTLNFVWDTTGVTPGGYTISAYAPILGDAEPRDNFLNGPIVGGVYEPIELLAVNWNPWVSLPFTAISVVFAGIASMGVFKLAETPLGSWRLTKRTRRLH